MGDRRASVIIIYHNEAFSVLVRMLNSIFHETPPERLVEVVLYDDFSDRKLRVDKHMSAYVELQRKRLTADAESVEAIGWTEKLKMHVAEKREGLIRAKVTDGWLLTFKTFFLNFNLLCFVALLVSNFLILIYFRYMRHDSLPQKRMF